MDRQLAPWRLDAAAPQHEALLTAIGEALSGTGPALATTTSPGEQLPDRVPGDTCLAIRTSGSTGAPRRALLSAAALVASAERTHARLGGPGRWVLALPLDHVAGLQVLVRSVVAGTEPLRAGSTAVSVAAAAEQAEQAEQAGRARTLLGATPRLYTALVPTQVHRIVQAAQEHAHDRLDEHPGEHPTALPPELAPLRLFDAILVGGSALPPPLLASARALGLAVVTTYGMTETAGGCVYDGVPLDDVRLAVDEGTIRIAGPTLASGYLADGRLSTDGFEEDPGTGRWFRTADLGRLNDGRLEVLGRRDDVVVTGGVNVAPAAVEATLVAVPGVAQVCVVGVPDPEWGQRVTAVVVPDRTGPPTLEALRDAVSRTLGSASAPRGLVVVDALPVRGPGKVDRAAVGRLAAGPPLP